MAEPTQPQTNDGDVREIVHHGLTVEVDVTQEQSHQQAFSSIETTNYSNSELVGTEQEYPGRQGSPGTCCIFLIHDRSTSGH